MSSIIINWPVGPYAQTYGDGGVTGQLSIQQLHNQIGQN